MKKWEKFSKEELQNFAYQVKSYAGLCEKIGYSKNSGSAAVTIKEMIEELELDTKHFTGQLWSKGNTKESDDRIISQEKYEIQDIFIKNSPISRKVIRGYVKRYGLIEYRCYNCGCDGNWMGKKIALQLHHIDGVNNNHELSNLTYLCPNCHAATDSYCGKNKNKQ